MSQFVLDDQLDDYEIAPLLKSIRWRYLRDLRPGEHILDDRVPEILLTVREPTFITIDRTSGILVGATRTTVSSSSHYPMTSRDSYRRGYAHSYGTGSSAHGPAAWSLALA